MTLSTLPISYAYHILILFIEVMEMIFLTMSVLRKSNSTKKSASHNLFVVQQACVCKNSTCLLL